jgi:hypothetical protein
MQRRSIKHNLSICNSNGSMDQGIVTERAGDRFDAHGRQAHARGDECLGRVETAKGLVSRLYETRVI